MKILRPEVIACLRGGESLMDVINNLMLSSYNITEDEMNFILIYSDNDEHEIFMDGIDGFSNLSTFTQKRLALEIRNKYIDLYNEIH